MKRQTISISFFICIAVLFSHLSFAEETSALAIHTGAFDFNKHDDPSAEFGLEYRFAPQEAFYDMIPVVGLTANTDGGYWVHTGIRYDIHLNDSWVLTPHVAASLYENGGSKDLGYGLEFRSGLEVAYKINASSHLGIGIYHLSNANLGRDNPGEESLIVSYSFSPDILK